MKKLLGIVVLGLLLSGNAYADYNVVLKCEVKKLEDPIDFEVVPIIFGKKGDTRYFHIIKKDDQLTWDVKSNWNPYDKYFLNWHQGDEMSARYIIFGTWPGERDTNSYMQINRETGEMIFLDAIEKKANGWYNSVCDTIQFNDLPIETVKQKF